MRVLLLLLLCPLAAAAQTGKLAGHVVDDLGDPLPGATIIVGDSLLTAVSDSAGDYLITEIPIGRYAVTVTSAESEASIDTVEVENGQTRVLDFELSYDWSCPPNTSHLSEDLSWQQKWFSADQPIAEAYGLAPLDQQSSGSRAARLWYYSGDHPILIMLAWNGDVIVGDIVAGEPLQGYEGETEQHAKSRLDRFRKSWAPYCGPIQRGPSALACALTLVEDPNWSELAGKLEEDNLWTLPDESALPTCSSPMIGGESFVAEIFDGKTYRAYHYLSPWKEAFWPEEQQAARLVETLSDTVDSALGVQR